MQKMHLNEIRGFFLGSVLTLLLLASIMVYAQQKWQAVWHGTDWIDSGETIRAREIAENFEYLLRKMNDLENQINIYINGTSTSQSNISGIVVAGCRLNIYPINDDCWGGATAVSGNRFNGYQRTVVCPPNTRKFVTSVLKKTTEPDGGDGGGPGSGTAVGARTYAAETAICIKN